MGAPDSRAHQGSWDVRQRLTAARLSPLAWYDVLLELRRNDRIGLRPIEIEQRLLIAQHNVSRLIDRLETEGFVRRESCPAAGRGQIVRIKPAGRSLLKRMCPVYGPRFSAPSAIG
jgi:DNA-binding MarR family transcriptional regulator